MRAAAFAALAASASYSAACSTVRIDTPDGPVIARTMELGGHRTSANLDLPWPYAVVSFMSGEAGGGALSYCNNTLSWKATYNHISLTNDPAVSSETMNTKGLTVSGQTLRESVYENEVVGGGANKPLALCWKDFALWAVANHGSVREVVAALDTVAVVIQGNVGSGLRLHWTVEDATEGVVVAYMNGKLVVHNNTVGVLTNDPPFDWHLRNLNNYVNIGSEMPVVSSGMQVPSEVGTVPRAVGHGINLKGLPGSPTPADRFVRMWYLREIAKANDPPRNITEGVALAGAVIDTVYLPKGAVATAANNGDFPFSYEFTQWTVIKVPSRLEFYFRGYQQDRWRVVHLDRLPPASLKYSIYQGTIAEAAEDVSDLRPKA